MLLYIHIPFCESKCGYCAFTSFVSSEEYFDVYVEALCKDLIHNLGANTKPISSIFIGGGTPNLLNTCHYESIFKVIHKYGVVAKDCEISIEANVNSLKKQWCVDLLALGANRLSIGVQSFNKEKLYFLERTHSLKDISNAINNAHNAGFCNINCDLMINTPLDNKHIIESDINKALNLPLKHISVYALSIDKNSHFDIKNYKCDATIDEEMSFYARDLLEQNGFLQYEVSNYAKENKQCRHNIGYWQGEEYIGCGAGAVGRVGFIRTSANKHLVNYINDPIQREIEILKDENLYMESIMLGLRCASGVDMSIFMHKDSKSCFKHLLEDGKCHIRIENGREFLCANELFLSDEIALWLLSRLG